MKPELTMSTNKDSIPEGPVVIAQMASTPEPRKRNTKKYLIIGGSVVAVIAIVLTAILVGMYFFTKAQTDLIKFTMNSDKETKEDVTVDRNDNSIEYHSQTDSYELWVVDDFNKDIQMLKVKTTDDTNCYLTPLNRTSLMDPSQISGLQNLPSKGNQTYSRRVSFETSGTPILDSSFLGQKAKDTCKGISFYWMYPKCSGPGQDEYRRSKRSCRSVEHCGNCWIWNTCCEKTTIC